MSASVVENIKLKRGDAGLGFNIKGGVDNPQVPGDTGIFVAKIRENGAAAKDKRLHEGDKILEINGVSLECVTHLDAVNQFLNAGDTVDLKVIPGALQSLRDAHALRNLGSANSSKKTTGGFPLLKVTIGIGVVAIFTFAAYRYYKHNHS